MFVNLWCGPISTLYVANTVHVVADVVCGQCRFPNHFLKTTKHSKSLLEDRKSLSQDQQTLQITAGDAHQPWMTENHLLKITKHCKSVLEDRKSLSQDHKTPLITAEDANLSWKTSSQSWKTTNHYLKTIRHWKWLLEDRKSISCCPILRSFLPARKRGNSYGNVAGWLSVCHSRYCIKMTKPILKLSGPSGSPII